MRHLLCCKYIYIIHIYSLWKSEFKVLNVLTLTSIRDICIKRISDCRTPFRTFLILLLILSFYYRINQCLRFYTPLSVLEQTIRDTSTQHPVSIICNLSDFSFFFYEPRDSILTPTVIINSIRAELRV
jgi:hypothetical protein